LGIIVSHKVEIDLIEITGVINWPTLSTKKEVQSVIGFVNFYCCFIPGFSHHTCTLFDFTIKDVRFNWGLPQEDSFIKLNTLAPVLMLPDSDLSFRLEANGSGITTGVVLSHSLSMTMHGIPSLSCPIH
jgi:hypothetical protein